MKNTEIVVQIIEICSQYFEVRIFAKNETNKSQKSGGNISEYEICEK